MKLFIEEQDVNIEVKHGGVLEVPDGKNVDDLPFSHFEKLAKKKGLSKITKALNNLQVWNKNDDKKLSKWAGDMIDKLNKKLKKDESMKEDYEYSAPKADTIFGYKFYSDMTKETFFVLSKNESDALDFGDELADIYDGDSDLYDELLDEYYDNLPENVYVTDPERDNCYSIRGDWFIEVEDGLGDMYEIIIVGDYSGRF